jgi:type I restriction enzyme S subunit
LSTSAVQLRDFCTFLSGGTPAVGNAAFWTGDICWVSPKDMGTDFLIDTEDHITMDAVNASATKLVPANSILVVTRSGILVRRLPIARTSKPMAFNQDIKAILVDSKKALTEYVAYFLKSREADMACTRFG